MNVAALLALVAFNAPAPQAATMNDFAFRFNRALVPFGTNENALLSGYSAQTALSMLAVGADSPSLEVLTKALGVPDRNAVLLANKAVTTDLLASEGAEFHVANGIWTLKDVTPSETFTAELKAAFGAEFRHLNGTGPEEVASVNGWVSDNTKGRIEKIIDSLDPSDRLVIINALSFDGKWKHPFDPKFTASREFKLGAGTTVEVPTMLMIDERFPYAKLPDGSRAVKIPYEGDEFAMLMILPKEGVPAADAFRDTNSETLKATLGKLVEARVRVQIPKLKIEKNYSLQKGSEAAEALGISPLFDNLHLGRVAPQLAFDTVLSAMIQKTFLEWDEEGTRAAAATGLIVGTTAFPVDPPQFIADRPFLFFLIHQPTGAVIFSGLVNDPR